jgi:hypothetical protein
MATTVSKTLDFTVGSSDINRLGFEPNGATGYLFSKALVPSPGTVADGTFVRLSRSGRQQSDFTDGDGAYLYTVFSPASFFNLSGPKFVKSIRATLGFNMGSNYGNMRITAITTSHPGEAGRWINGRCATSSLYAASASFPNHVDPYVYTQSSVASDPRCQAFIYYGGGYTTACPGNDSYKDSGWQAAQDDFGKTKYVVVPGPDVNAWNRPSTDASAYASTETVWCMVPDGDTSDIGGYIIGSVPYQSNQYKVFDIPSSGVIGDLGKILLIDDTVTIRIPLNLRIPQTQHVWTDWPWNKSVKTLTTEMRVRYLTIQITYETILEYKGKFLYPQGGDLGVGGYLYKGTNKSGGRLDPGYVSISGYFYGIENGGLGGGIISRKKCQSSILIASASNGSVSSSYPYSNSGYTSYSFNPDVDYITLDAIASSGYTFTEWQATDFDGTTLTISTSSTLDVYNGEYESVQPLFTQTSGTTCYVYNVTYTSYYSYNDCNGIYRSDYLIFGDTVCADSPPYGMVSTSSECAAP